MLMHSLRRLQDSSDYDKSPDFNQDAVDTFTKGINETEQISEVF